MAIIRNNWDEVVRDSDALVKNRTHVLNRNDPVYVEQRRAVCQGRPGNPDRIFVNASHPKEGGR